MRQSAHRFDEARAKRYRPRDDFAKAVGPNRWVKRSPVLAYRTAEACLVECVIGDHVEGRVTARPGDWIVRQYTGEMMVLDDDEAEKWIREYLDEHKDIDYTDYGKLQRLAQLAHDQKQKGDRE